MKAVEKFLRQNLRGQIYGKIVQSELSLFLSLSFGQGNSGESNSTWFHDRLTGMGGYKRRFRTEDGDRSTFEEVFSRSVKIGKVLAWVNSLLKRLFLTRNCLKLVYTRTSEIDSPSPPALYRTALRMRLIFLPGCAFIPNGLVNDSSAITWEKHPYQFIFSTFYSSGFSINDAHLSYILYKKPWDKYV